MMLVKVDNCFDLSIVRDFDAAFNLRMSISIKLRVLNAVPKLIAYIGLLPAFWYLY